VRLLTDIVDEWLARTSFTLVMLTASAAVALLLGLVEIYRVISYSVSQRTLEIGIRLALGARQGEVRRMFLRHGLVLTAIGIAVGLGAAIGLTRLMSALLFGVSPVDAATFSTVGVALGTIALLASYIPARRASSVDPIRALRWE
jgi:putative ABC transport system permease protein